MNLKNQKRISADILKCSPKRIVFDNERLEDIKESITKADLRNLINDKAITKKNKKGVSRVRARKIALQKKKGRRRGYGKRKGSQKVRINLKRTWIRRVRLQRSFVKMLRDKDIINKKVYRSLYLKVKGGFFRSKRHIKLYIEERNLSKKE